MAALSTDSLQEMDPYDFEKFIADLWRLDGWTTEVSPSSGDRGRDVIATKRGTVDQKQIIECKRYSRPVGPSKVREYAGVRARETDADQVIIVTTSRYTKGARQEAEDLNVKLVNGEEIVEMVERLGAEDVLEKYSPADDSEGITISFAEGANEDLGTYYAKVMGVALTAIGGVGMVAPGTGDEFGLLFLLGVVALVYAIHQQGEISV